MQILVGTCGGGLTDGDGCGEKGGGRRYNFDYPYSRSINNNYKHTPGGKDCEHVQITSRKYKVSLLHKLLRNTMPNSSFPVHSTTKSTWSSFNFLCFRTFSNYWIVAHYKPCVPSKCYSHIFLHSWWSTYWAQLSGNRQNHLINNGMRPRSFPFWTAYIFGPGTIGHHHAYPCHASYSHSQ